MKLGITIGDFNGIGIELIIKSISKIIIENPEFISQNEIVIIGSQSILQDYLKNFDYPVFFEDGNIYINNKRFNLIEIPGNFKIEFGKNTESAGRAAGLAIEKAIKKAIVKELDAIVTMPISKESLQKAGWNFPGHTEFLAKYCGIEKALMILFGDKLKVALVTSHIPINQISSVISQDLIIEKLFKFHHSLKLDFGISEPKIAVLGLNPHSGEGGSIGREEIEIITPAIQISISEGINPYGPFPSDSFFGRGLYRNFDGILAMYHDQGLIPLKMLDNNSGVNFTAGLPIVRTSPDHGTAFDIAGKGIADERSAVQAIYSAVEIAIKRLKVDF